MITTMITKTTGPQPATVREKRNRKDSEDRLHVSALMAGLIDSRACHIDFLDTAGGEELVRWYRRRHPGRRHLRH
jgi:hypothetical protein